MRKRRNSLERGKFGLLSKELERQNVLLPKVELRLKKLKLSMIADWWKGSK